MKITVAMGEIWPRKWGPWLMVLQISFLKCDVLSQFQDHYSKVLLSLLMTSSFKGNKLYSLPSRFTEQKARLGWGGACFFSCFFFTTSIQEIIDHSLLLLECYWVGCWRCPQQSYTNCFFSVCLSWNDGVEKMFHQLKLRKMVTPSRQKCLDGKHQTGKLRFINGNYCADLHLWCSSGWHPDWMRTIPWVVCQMGSTFGAIGFLEPRIWLITWKSEFWP